MTPEESMARYAVLALDSAAGELGVEPLTMAKRLQDGEIARLIRLLNAAAPHVSTPALRHRIEDLLSAVTDGRMPMFEEPETELDWAMATLRKRRTDQQSEGSEDPGKDGE